MKIFRYVRVSLESIRAHKLRAALTMLGIIIGVAAVLTTVGMGSGAAASITERIESSGTNLLTISASGSSTLTMQDAATLADPAVIPEINALAAQYSSNASVTRGDTEESYQVTGATANYLEISNGAMAAGAYLTEEQEEKNESVAVLGWTVADDLFSGLDPVGETIRIENNLFTVIGVLEEVGSGFSSDETVYVPLGTAQTRLFNASHYRGSYNLSSIIVQVVSGDELDTAEGEIERVLRLRHGLAAEDGNDFRIMNQADMLEMASDISGTLSALLGSIGAVSLVVGGIGIMNIMLVSVTERTREIGLRKAVGAHNNDILLQFLIEALVLCALGGLIGVGISYGAAYFLGNVGFMPFQIIIQPWAVGLALVVSTGSGFIFGLYPALRATRLDPIDALRYE